MINSVALATSRNMEHKHMKLKSEYTSKLEVESQRMEDRLKMLKTMLAAEKARRNTEGAIHWKSTNLSCSPKQPASQSLADGQSPKPIRVRILTNKEGKKKLSKLKSTPCGQCDRSNASLSCIECVENYCQVCFVKIHQKGALAHHHVKPFSSKISTKAGDTTAMESKEAHRIKQTSSLGVGTQEPAGSLLDGMYDEASSAASFQQALAKWRAERVGESKTTSERGENTNNTRDCTTITMFSASTGTSTDSNTGILNKSKKIEVSFTHDTGVSYLEKLVTRRSRYDSTLIKKMAPKQTAPAPIANNTLDYKDEEEVTITGPTQYNIFYKPDNQDILNALDEDCGELYRPLSSLQIQEISEPLVISTTTNESPQQQVNTRSSNTTKSNIRAVSSGRPKSTRSQSSKKSRKNSTNKAKPNNTTTVAMKEHKKPPPSQIPELKMQTSVQKAWVDCSKIQQQGPPTAELSQFFLQGVDSPATMETTSTKQVDSSSNFDTQMQFAATIWLPDNSIAMDTEPRHAEHHFDGDSDCEELPDNSHCNTALSSKYQQNLESLEQLIEKNEWDKEDNAALESLEWELASTVESEGRLSRCDSQLEAMADQFENEHLEDLDVEVRPVDMSQVVSEFELYQQQLLDQEM